MADLKLYIAGDATLTGRKAKDVGWAISAVAKAFGQDMAAMPACPVVISDHLKGFAPAMAGFTEDTWANAMSLNRFALRKAGIITKPARSIVKFAPAWTALMKLPPLMHDQIALSRLARFCTEENIDPDDVNDGVFDSFLKDITHNTVIRRPHIVHQRAAVVWNKLANTTPNWPSEVVKVPSYSRVYFLGWDKFSASLVEDIDAHLFHLSGENVLDSLGVRPLKPGSLKTRRHQLGAYLSGLVLRGEDPACLKTLADAVEVPRVRKGLLFLLDRVKNGSKAQAYDVARMLLSIARHWVKAPPAQLLELKAFCKNLEDIDTGMSEKNRSRLRPLDDDDTEAALLDLPGKILARVKRAEGPPTKAAALQVQMALAMELLLMVPMRRENLTRLNIKEHFDRRRNGVVHLVVPGSEVKNGVEIEAIMVPSFVKILDLYMKTYQPLLAEAGSPWLFPGLPGRHKSVECMGGQISETIKKETGLLVHTHLFRHIAAKIYLDRNPGNYAMVQRMLGHKSIKTTMRMYTGMESKSAYAKYNGIVLGLRNKRGGAARGKQG